MNRRGLLKGMLGALALMLMPMPIAALLVTRQEQYKSVLRYDRGHWIGIEFEELEPGDWFRFPDEERGEWIIYKAHTKPVSCDPPGNFELEAGSIPRCCLDSKQRGGTNATSNTSDSRA